MAALDRRAGGDAGHPMRLALRLDGHDVEADIDPEATLAEVLREDFGVRSVRIGCANGDCGACTARVDDRLLKTCMVLPHRAQGACVTTLAGLGSEDEPSPVQTAFVEAYAFQCGFCLPGMVLASHDLLERDPEPDESTIRDALSGNLCRCTGYSNAVRAVRRASSTTSTCSKSESEPNT
jgi:carbon-monoxide dehydrogenase small subunit